MRNLKKILALVLALVMSLSLMATASAAGTAAATDAATAYKTAIDVLTGLKVVIGDAGGIRANDEITRAEAATLIYRVHTADVTDSKVYLHTDHPFTDVASTSWMNSYVSYAYNAQIVKGKTTTTFEPGVNITGYETLAMTLRALGYGKNGEFEGGEWKIQTAAWSQRIGLFNGISAADSTDYALNQNASRGFVFQVMFNAVLMDQVAYSAYTPDGYSSTGTSMADGLGLEDIKGVVVANRIADLEDTEPLADGKTRMIVDGKNMVLNVDTTAEQIGLAYHAYVKDGEVLAGLEDAGNTVGEPENGKGSKVESIAKDNGLKLNGDTEYFVNFDPVRKDTSDWRLEYVITKKMTQRAAYELVRDNDGKAWIDTDGSGKVDNGETVIDADVVKAVVDWSNLDNDPDHATVYTYNKVIPVRQTITTQDHDFIWDIFEGSDSAGGVIDADDSYWGEVYAATRSGSNSATNTSYDISDELNYWEFYEKYIDEDKNNSFTSSDNGEWLRVIDNDGDGNADYVLRTDFVMTTITNYDKRTDTYSVEYDVDEKGSVDTEIKASAIRAEDDVDLSVGAVVLYAKIDSYYYTTNPEVQTKKVDDKSINVTNETFTSDGETFTWSGIDKEADEYYKTIIDIDEKSTYELYLDHFGYVRLATESNKGLVLLTDAYYWTNYRDSEYKADLYIGSEFIEETDVVDKPHTNSADGFVDTQEDNSGSGSDHGNRGTWLRLNTFGEFYYDGETNVYNTKSYVHYVDADASGAVAAASGNVPNANTSYKDPFVTNVAAYTEEDGVYSLYDVTDVEILGTRRTYNAYEVLGTEKGYTTPTVKAETVKAMNRTLWGIAHNGTDALGAYRGWINGDTVNEDKIQQVQTNGSTVYYFVANPGTSKQAVTSWTGYENVPSDLGNFTATRAYVISHVISSTDDYEIADVVVFEGAKEIETNDAWLIVSAINTKRERALGPNGDDSYGDTTTNFEVFDNGQTLAANLYYDAANTDGLQAGQAVFVDENGDRITSNFAKYGIYAAVVNVAPGTRNDNYCEVRVDADQRYFWRFYTDEVNVFELNQITEAGEHASRNLVTRTGGVINQGDKLIVIVDSDKNVLMAVNVSKSGKDGARDGGIEKLNNLYADIEADWEVDGLLNVDVTVKKDGNEVDDADLEIAGLTKIGDEWYIANDAKETILTFKVDGKYTVSSVTFSGNGTLYNMDPDNDGNVQRLLAGVSKTGGNLTLVVNVGTASYKINPVNSKLGEAAATPITDANLTLDGGAWTANGPSVSSGSTVKVAFTIAGAVPVKVAVLDEDGEAVTGLDNLAFTATGTPDQYEVSFQMPAQNIQILVNTKAGFVAKLDPSSSGVTFDDANITAGDSLDDVSITLAPDAGKKVLAENVTIKMGEQTIGKSFYSVDEDSGAITWNTTGTYDASAILVTDDIVITATATDPVRTITINIQDDKDSSPVAEVALNVDADAEGNVYTVSQTDDVTLTITAKSAEALANGIEVTDGKKADMSPVASIDGKTFTVTISADAENVVVNIKELVEITLVLADESNDAITNNGLTETDTTFLVANGTVLNVEGTCDSGDDKVEASDGDAGTGTEASCTSGNFSIKITASGSATWTITTSKA